MVSILFYNSNEFIKLLYTFLVNSFARYKHYITCLISFSKFSDVLPAFTGASAIGLRHLFRIQYFKQLMVRKLSYASYATAS